MKIRLDVGSAHGIANFVARFSYVGKWNPQCNVFSKNCIDRLSIELKKISEEKHRSACFKSALDNAWKKPSIIDVNILPVNSNTIRYEFSVMDPHSGTEMRMTKIQDKILKIFQQKIVDLGRQCKIRTEFKVTDHRTWHCGGSATM